jgi:hypothetical protein
MSAVRIDIQAERWSPLEPPRDNVDIEPGGEGIEKPRVSLPLTRLFE